MRSKGIIRRVCMRNAWNIFKGKKRRQMNGIGGRSSGAERSNTHNIGIGAALQLIAECSNSHSEAGNNECGDGGLGHACSTQ